MMMVTAVKVVIMLLCVLLNVAFFTLVERKLLGYIQIRKGPNKVGFKGVLQPFSDAVKLFTKELNQLGNSNTGIFIVGPVLSLSIMLSLWLSTPSLWGVMEVELSSVFLLCCLSLGVYPVFMSGWASNSKYSLLGGLRAIAQTISYEVSLALVMLSLLIMVGGLNLSQFYSYGGWLMSLNTPILCMAWLITCLAETGRSPFDLPEGESELVSGFNTEYSSGSFALFFLGEYGSMLFLSYTSSILLLSQGPSDFTTPVKCLILIFMFVWARGTLPRFRYDFLMSLTWKVFLPVSLGYFMLYTGLVLYSI
uniref:NADH-ubiquinone oxidoreductase chain 1 n=1 Tax=Gyge ovalis TaxID=2008693 RepID=A0A343DSD3_9CRUS|nr:NADH dehydrogenase subunit 1 [Gyge ovalis]ASC43040.1 NADH dehydrogenase subunit 1 [Gyge ovalis]